MTVFWLAISAMTLTAIAIVVFPLCVKKPHPIKTIMALAILLPALAITLYLKLGANRAVEQQIATNAEIQKFGTLDAVILQLKQTVMAKPDARGWFLLGRLYLKSQRYVEAMAAFEEANRLTPDQADILMGYAESAYFANDESFTPKARQLVQRVLQLHPNQPDAVNLLAMDAYQHQDYPSAIHYWEQLLPLLTQGSEESKQLLQMIADTQKKLSTAKTKPIRLTVQVALDQALKKQISPTDTVFVYAQAINGPPMPLAVVRRPARDLPLEVTLDESMAMIPTATLANYAKIRVIARISKSGQAMPVAGDLEGASEVIDAQHSPAVISVHIDGKVNK